MAQLTVIISYYKSLENLRLILKGLAMQSLLNFEVILSEDDNNPETDQFIKKEASKYPFCIIHLNQAKDDGFKKASMLNRCIQTATSDKLALIDGDCIPNRHFVKHYADEIDEVSFCIGRAVMLDEATSDQIKQTNSFKPLAFRKLILSKSQKVKEGFYFPYFPISIKLKGLVGRNWGVHKNSLVAVNGFDTDYKYAGVGEDCDIEWRLLAHGIEPKSIKNKAIVYHIYHPRWYATAKERENYALMEQKIKKNQIKCLNGIETLS